MAKQRRLYPTVQEQEELRKLETKEYKRRFSEQELKLSAEMEAILNLARRFASIEKAPAIRLDHFLLAQILVHEPYEARRILSTYKIIVKQWEKEL